MKTTLDPNLSSPYTVADLLSFVRHVAVSERVDARTAALASHIWERARQLGQVNPAVPFTDAMDSAIELAQRLDDAERAAQIGGAK